MNTTKSQELYNQNKDVILQVTPFRTPVLVKGKGNKVWDADGNEYLDMMSGQFCLAFGHSYTPLNRIITKQLTKLTHTNTLSLTEEMFDAARELASITGGNLKKTILLSTGAEAVECALRYAKFYTKKDGIVGIDSGYHGLTLATQSISSKGMYAMPKVQDSFSIPSPDWLDRPQGLSVETFITQILQESRQRLEQYKGKVAAFVVEPVISVGGMIYPPKEYFEGIRDLAKEHNALLIFDECQTGLGRTGTWFGYEHYGIIPDILVLAKISGAGFPASAVVMSTEIADAVEGKFIHFSSHQNDPLSGAILAFVIRYMKEKHILKKINDRGNLILRELKKLQKSEPWLEHPRGMGLMLGFDVPQRLFANGRNPGADLITILENNGVIIQAIRRGRTFRILPDYLISRPDCIQFIEKLRQAFIELHQMYG